MSTLRKIIFTFFINSLSLSFQSLIAQETPPIKTSSSISTDSAYIGDIISYEILANHSENITILYPSSVDSAFGNFEIIDVEKSDPKKENESFLQKVNYKISVYDTGHQIIPQLSLKYLEGTEEKMVTLPPKSIYIKSVLDTAQKIIDIKAVKAPSFPFWILWIAILSLISVAAIAYFLYKKNLFRKPKKSEKPFTPQKPPYDLAMEKINVLKSMKLENQRDFKDFFTNLSLILREFLEGEYKILALEQTPSEIRDALVALLSKDKVDDIGKILDQSELVKFAKFYPTIFEARECLNLCIKFVELHKPTRDDISRNSS